MTKRALEDLLHAEGTSLSNWVQDQLDVLAGQPELPRYAEIRDPSQLGDPRGVFEDLSHVDWSFSNEDTSYLSHDIHPYPAKFIPQIPGTLIARLSLRGELVLDPFGGSGTTALEALRLGRRALSIDANPLGSLIGRVKTSTLAEPATTQELRALVAGIRARLASMPDSPEGWIHDYEQYIPAIPNLDKWFEPWPIAELALVKGSIDRLKDPVAVDLASLALSRTVLRASNQESETRYVAVPDDVARGFVLGRFLHELGIVVERVRRTSDEIQYGLADFVTEDARFLPSEAYPDSSVDLVVTSPPYGNANDYHLYHRFRLFWLGFEPKDLADVEIGSHLRHQREQTGFMHYMKDMSMCLQALQRILKPGRYAVLVVGDAIYGGEHHDAATKFTEAARQVGFESVGNLRRPLPDNRRSFKAGRRAKDESLMVLRKPDEPVRLALEPPMYRMWLYERALRRREARALLGAVRSGKNGLLVVRTDPLTATKARRMTFSRGVAWGSHIERTWQAVLENGLSTDPAARKDPKYATHGLHAYKGKFYPQLAKALMNISDVPEGGVILDPFCGSGTTLLEAHLNGLQARGADLHPLARKIASAKVQVLDLPPSLVRDVVEALEMRVSGSAGVTDSREQFASEAVAEIESWFPAPVVSKLDWLLANIRSLSYGVLQDFLEVILSDLLREVSHQEPSDLRIRRRKTPLKDADVFGLFGERLRLQMSRLEKFWRIRGFAPSAFYPAMIVEGDTREAATLKALGLSEASADLVLTSPPYATALPYIDTDRLSLLVLFGTTGSQRRPLEQALTGSREISPTQRRDWEQAIERRQHALPRPIVRFVDQLARDNADTDAGFRRLQLPALLMRFFDDMRRVLLNVEGVMKPGAELVMVLGDNFTHVNGLERRIPTTDFVAMVADQIGLERLERVPITVTKENVIHSRNAITENTALRFRKPS